MAASLLAHREAVTRESVQRLRTALRRERARGRAGHWTYDLTRHLALAHQLREAERALRLEERSLAAHEAAEHARAQAPEAQRAGGFEDPAAP